MSLSRHVLLSTLWTFFVGLYRRFELNAVGPAIDRARRLLLDLSSADKSQAALVDLTLFLVALTAFVWMCSALRHNWFFQWLYYFAQQALAFVFFGYGAMFSLQTMVMIALIYPEHLESLQQLVFGTA